MHKNSDIHGLSEGQTLAYVLRCISDDEDQIVERFDGDMMRVKTWIDSLKQIHFVGTNLSDELVITSDGKNFLQKFDSRR